MTKKYRVKVSCPGFTENQMLEAANDGDVKSYHNIWVNPKQYPDIFEEVPEPESEFVEVEIEPDDSGWLRVAVPENGWDWTIDNLQHFPTLVGFKFEGSEQVYAYSRGWQDKKGVVWLRSDDGTVPVTANRAVFRRQA